ncbi:hypothetical protein FQR65_LT01950 [Abscondita terminalis]|nr:hypothetical protein FQR65_LT01950 [Abscondita terminalis]
MHVLLFGVVALAIGVFGDYYSDRDDLIKKEESFMLGADVQLTYNEKIVNEFLMTQKLREFDDGFANPGQFSPSRHFFEVRDAIEESAVFQFIKKMPKGGALHGHDTALISFDELFKFTYEDNLYACIVADRLMLKFMEKGVEQGECKWRLVEDLRDDDPLYDEFLKSHMTLVTEKPREKYNDINEAWGKLNKIFATVTPMITYRPVLEKYVYQSLLELYEDNVYYLEFRGTLPEVYELNGYIHNASEVLGIYKEVISKFKKDYPRFIDAKFIYAPSRNVNNATVDKYVEIVEELVQKYPSTLVGFDLVGQEDKGRPLVEFVSRIQNVSKDINFIFHAGETNWFGASTDLNLVDAILLGTKRIGHGSCIGNMPISNQVLMLVEDLRNHPGTELIASGYPVVISYDDPSYWGSKGLSYDFYVAFMGMARRCADLKLLKKLAENSLVYSALPPADKDVAIKRWREQWDSFINATYHRVIRLHIIFGPIVHKKCIQSKFDHMQEEVYFLHLEARAVLALLTLCNIAFGDYWSKRDALVGAEEAQSLGHDVVLTKEEELVNTMLMKHKLEEFDKGFHNPRAFLPSRHFFEVRSEIEKSMVYKFIRMMPKGGLLHAHGTSLLSFNAIYKLTYEPNLHACVVNNRVLLKFLEKPVTDKICKWKLLKDLRKSNSTYVKFLKSQLSLVIKNPRQKYHDTNGVWKAFAKTSSTLKGLLSYKPVMEKYIYSYLLELYEDNVLYLEFRSAMRPLYELNGYTHSQIQVAKIYKEVIKTFQQKHPDFMDARFIYSFSRNSKTEDFRKQFKFLKQLKREFPNFLVGLDFVGQEDKSTPLSDLVNLIVVNISSTNQLFLHAGETNWLGTGVDSNLIDAVLLGAKRIAHGYAIVKHPLLMNAAKQKKIAIEVCPISNQVFMLIDDMRNHPGAQLIANGYPIVIGSDSPGLWGGRGLSYDFYMAFMGMANRNADLKLLKKLAENSFAYSGLTVVEKQVAVKKWWEQWDIFINTLYLRITKYGLGEQH